MATPRAADKWHLHMLAISAVHGLLTAVASGHLPLYSFQGRLWLPHSPAIAALAQFDGTHFLANDYSYQQNFAFLPGYTCLCRLILYLSSFNYQIAIIILVLINKALTYLAIAPLTRICHACLLPSRLTRPVILLFIYNPAAVFFHSVYSEPLYVFITFTAIAALLHTNSASKYIMLLALAGLVRSTAIFLLPIIGIPLLTVTLQNTINLRVRKALANCAWGVTILGFVFLPLVGYLWWAYTRMCANPSLLQICSESIPNIYSWVQARYWNVGFFTYYSPQNTLFIVIGLPAVVFSLLFLTLPDRANPAIFGLQFSFMILLAVTIAFTNIQSSTRFLCSHPLFYINAVVGMEDRPMWRFWFKGWSLGMCLCGIVLFAIGFPWT